MVAGEVAALASRSVPRTPFSANGTCSAASQAAIRASASAPRLSELEMKAYRRPALSRASRVPDAASAV